MNKYLFHDEYTLSEAAVELGKKALKLGLIRSFVVRYYPDCNQFYIPNEKESDPLTPEQAYLRLNKLIQATAK